jgi:excisionase family DNA binding protein
MDDSAKGKTMGVYITVEQAATLLHVSPTTVRRWIYQGSLKAKKPPTGRNARVLIDKDDLEAFLTPAGTTTLSCPSTSRQTAVETILALQQRLAGRGIDLEAVLEAHQQERERA